MRKRIMVTGSTDGIGRRIVEQLLQSGQYAVVAHARSQARGAELLESLGNHEGKLDLVVGDFSRLSEVAGVARSLSERSPCLDVLVNNAGVGIVTPRSLTEDGFDLVWQVNYLAPVLLTKLLLPLLTAAAPSRVVNVASVGHLHGTGLHLEDVSLAGAGYQPEAYCQSKLAMVMWNHDLAAALKPAGVAVNAVHPGTFVDTKMVRARNGTPQMSVDEGAMPVLKLATSAELEGVTGVYFDRFDAARSAAATHDLDLRRRLAALTESMLRPYVL